jgi:hypothetical protein
MVGTPSKDQRRKVWVDKDQESSDISGRLNSRISKRVLIVFKLFKEVEVWRKTWLLTNNINV